MESEQGQREVELAELMKGSLQGRLCLSNRQIFIFI